MLDTLKPQFAIVAYGNKLGTQYLEKGDFIPDSNNEFQLTGLRPFLTDELTKLQTIVMDGKGLYMDGISPMGLIYLNNHPSNAIIMWHEKAGKRFLNFKNKKLRKEYDVPDTVFMMHNDSIYIYLLKKKDAGSISLNTNLYLPHYFNIWESGQLCIGSGYRPNVDYSGVNEMIKKISNDFWTDSYFTHPNHSHHQLIDTWSKNNGKYPEKQWQKLGTINSILSKYVKI